MTLYEKNLRTLDGYYPGAERLIRDAAEEAGPGPEIRREVSGDGRRVSVVSRNGRTCYLGGKRNASEPVRVWLRTLGRLAPNSPVFLMGLGNSGYLEELAANAENRITIIAYEPSLHIFLDFLETVDLAPLMERHLVVFVTDGIRGMDRESIPLLADRLLSFSMLAYSRYMVLPNYEVLFPEESVEFLRQCRKSAMGGIVQRNTNRTFSTVLAKNLFSNAVHLCDGYKTTQLVEAVPAGMPGIIVAAGPSLNKNIGELKNAVGKSFMIAVDTAVKPLLREGIRPDMIMMIDGKKPLKLFEAEGIHDIPIVSNLDAASEVLDYHRGMKFFFEQGIVFTEKIFRKSAEPRGTVPSGGSVATSAFSLMIKLGLTRIILVGQDLAFTNNRTHADGTFKERMDEINTSHMHMVEGNYEEKVPTPTNLKQFLDWYEDTIRANRERIPGFRVINATEGGARIAGTEIMTLREAVALECTEEADIAGAIRGLDPMLDAEARKWAVGYLKGIPGECEEFRRNAGKLKGLYLKLDRICDKQNLDGAEYTGILRKIGRQISRVERSVIYQLAASTLMEAHYAIESEQFFHEKTVAAEGKEIARKGILYMEMMQECGRIFGEYTGEIYRDLE